ncbi:hypothetical protein ACEWY4_017651 [Coilia grayii]|uniref:KASH domain-containing protein n=1 Tax=Coilia grayii TaxID=363190 RepID=A0ABD1JHS7_9TELE
MKRIQPFTIGTKLSIPVEPRWSEGVDIYLSSPTSTDGCKQKNDQNRLKRDCSDAQSWTQQPADDPQVISPVDSDTQEDQTSSDSPSSSSRSIKKIAICTSVESRDEHCTSPTRESHCQGQGFDSDKVSSTHRTSPTAQPGECGDLSSQLKNESRSRMRPRDPKCSGGTIPTCPPSQHSEGTAQAQQWELKDFENSLIQLTASLDFREEDAQEKHKRIDLSPEKLRESEAEDDEDKDEDEDKDDLSRPWLKLRALLRNYQKDLMLALDVSNFYQQADNLIKTINSKRRNVASEADVGEIAIQIQMLREAGSRLSDLHSTLATRVTRKQAEVKHSWARLQDALRNQRPEDHPQTRPRCSANDKSSDPTQATQSASAEPSEVQGIMGKDIKEEQNRLKGVEDTIDLWDRRRLMTMTDAAPEDNTQTHDVTTESTEAVDEWNQQVTDSSTVLSEDRDNLPVMVEASSADKTQSWLRDNIAMAFDQEKLDEDPDSPKIEELLRQVETLWEVLRRRERRPETSSSDTPAEKEDEEEQEEEEEVVVEEEEVMAEEKEEEEEEEEEEGEMLGEEEESCSEVKECAKGSPRAKVLPENVGECDSGMLTKFLEHLEQKDNHGMWQVVRGAGDQRSGCFSVSANETLEVRVDLSKTGGMRRTSPAQDQHTEQLINLLSTLTLRINEHLSRCAELSMDILELESNMATLCEPDLMGLEGLQEQQDDLEVDFHIMAGEVEDMEKLATHLKTLPPERSLFLGEEVQATLQAWEEVGRSLAENRGRLSKFKQLQEFFDKYLAMIAWAETTRSCMFSSGSVREGGEEERSKMADLDLRIQQKMEEFTQLTADGQTLTDDGLHVAEIIRERTEELQSMLGWIQDNWRTQKEQLTQRRRAPDVASEGSGSAALANRSIKATGPDLSEPQRVVENITPPAQPISSAKDPISQSSGPEQQQQQQHTGSVSSSLSVPSAPRVAVVPVNNSCGSGSNVTSMVVDDAGKAPRPLGNSICLILSFDEEERRISQVQKPTELPAEESSEATHRVSTFLHVNDSNKTAEKIGEDAALSRTEEREPVQNLPRTEGREPVQNLSRTEGRERLPLSPRLLASCCSSSSSSSSSSTSSSSSSSSSPSSSPCSPCVPAISSVFIPTLLKMATIPSCLGEKIMTPPGRSSQRRGSMPGVPGLDVPVKATASATAAAAVASRPNGATYCTNTWPLGCRKQRRLPSTNTKLQVYVKPNPLLLNSSSVQSGRPVADAIPGREHMHVLSHQAPVEGASGPAKNQCCYLSMGSTLSFNLPKDLGRLPSLPVINVSDPSKPARGGHTKTGAVVNDAPTSHQQQPPRPTAFTLPNDLPSLPVTNVTDPPKQAIEGQIKAVTVANSAQTSHQQHPPRPTSFTLPKDLGWVSSLPVTNVSSPPKQASEGQTKAGGIAGAQGADQQPPQPMVFSLPSDLGRPPVTNITDPPKQASEGQIKAVAAANNAQTSHQQQPAQPMAFSSPNILGCLPSLPVFNVSSPPNQASEGHMKAGAVANNAQTSHQQQPPRPTALPITTTTHQDPPQIPLLLKQKQFILSPVEEAKHETAWEQEAEKVRTTDTVLEPSQSSKGDDAFTRKASDIVPESSQCSKSDGVSTSNSNVTVSAYHDCTAKGTDPATVQSKIALTSSGGKSEDVVQKMEVKVKDEDGVAGKTTCVHVPVKLPLCTAHPPTPTCSVNSPSHPHQCLSAHTKIKDLNGHIYHRPKELSSSQSKSIISTAEHTPTISTDSASSSQRLSVCKTGRIIVCAESSCVVCSDSSVSTATAGSKTTKSQAHGNRVEFIQPGRWEFEQEEEELKGIWDGKGNQRDRRDVQAGAIRPAGSKVKTRRTRPLEKPGEPLIQCPPLQSVLRMAHRGCPVFACEDKSTTPLGTAEKQQQQHTEWAKSAFSLKSKPESSGRSVQEFSLSSKNEQVAFTLTLPGGPSGHAAVQPSDGSLKLPGRTEEEAADTRLPHVTQSAFTITSAN